jgi:hypothetical protein
MLLPARHRDVLRFWYMTISAKGEAVDIPVEIYDRLRDHFLADQEYIETVTGTTPLWFKHERKRAADGKSIYRL